MASSGYADDPVMAHYAHYGFQGIVPKPYTVETLSTALQRVLSAPPDDAPPQGADGDGEGHVFDVLDVK
jgi:hypothetical protein